jgi:HD-GYP domain-containing protein (c-di-GMP phosphodiesterase class II)
LDKLHPLVETMVSDAPVLEELYRIALSTRGEGGDLSSHLIHVATFCVKLGRGLRLADAKLKRLNLAALLHDVGMCLVSRKLPDKKGKLTAQETALIQRHPEYGFQVVNAHLGDDFLWLAEVIRQEHERDNGSGFLNNCPAMRFKTWLRSSPLPMSMKP